MTHGLEKAISGLKKTVEQYKKQDLIKIGKDRIEIQVNDKQFWGSIFYLSLIILTPFSLLLYYLFFNQNNSEVFWLLLFVILFSYELRRKILGDNILTINLKDGFLEVRNINAVFKKFFKVRLITFSDLAKVTMEEKAAYSKYKTVEWYELTVYDKRTNKTVLTSFDDKFPLPSIGNRVKLIIDLILKEQKEFDKSSSS